MSEAAGHYYVPDWSRWPIFGSISLFTMAFGFVLFLNDVAAGHWLMVIGVVAIIAVMFGWFGTVIIEGINGKYNQSVDYSFRMGMGWFIYSEVMFFAAFFGALFYIRWFAVPWLSHADMLWPGYDGGWPTAGPEGPLAIASNTVAGAGQFSFMGPWGIPFLNTAILLSSSVTVTIAHWALKNGHRGKLILWLAFSVILGATFLYFQADEYIHAYHELGLTLGTGIYGATFFMLTGFHGFHVAIGTIFLLVILLRCIRGHFDAEHHFAFEAAAWYWHFVDTVWVFLFIFVYIA